MRSRRKSLFGRRAAAAIEFAILAPVFVLLLAGIEEIVTLYRTAAKLEALAANVAEMVSVQPVQAGQSPTPVAAAASGSAGLADICAGAQSGLLPFSPNGLSVAVASVTYEPVVTNGVLVRSGYDVWEADQSCGSAATPIGATAAINRANGNQGAAGAPSPSSAMLLNVGDNVIIVRATLAYPGFVGVILDHALTLTETAYARWRLASASTELVCAGAGSLCQCPTTNTNTDVCQS